MADHTDKVMEWDDGKVFSSLSSIDANNSYGPRIEGQEGNLFSGIVEEAITEPGSESELPQGIKSWRRLDLNLEPLDEKNLSKILRKIKVYRAAYKVHEVHSSTGGNLGVWEGLESVPKARQALRDTLGSCWLCLIEKKTCYVSHHALEDLVDKFPDAKDHVVWAINQDSDPRQEERSMHPPRRSSVAPSKEAYADAVTTPHHNVSLASSSKRHCEEEAFQESSTKRAKKSESVYINPEEPWTPIPFVPGGQPIKPEFGDRYAPQETSESRDNKQSAAHPSNAATTPFQSSPNSPVNVLSDQHQITLNQAQVQHSRRLRSLSRRHLEIAESTDRLLDIIEPRPKRGIKWLVEGVTHAFHSGGPPDRQQLSSNLDSATSLAQSKEHESRRLSKAPASHENVWPSTFQEKPTSSEALLSAEALMSAGESPSIRLPIIKGVPEPCRPSRPHYEIDIQAYAGGAAQARFIDLVRQDLRRRKPIPVNEENPLLQGDSAFSSGIQGFQGHPAAASSGSANQQPYPNNPSPQGSRPSNSTPSNSSHSGTGPANTGNTSVSGGPDQGHNGAAGQSQGQAPSANGTDINQAAAGGAGDPSPGGFAILIGFLKADPALMMLFDLMLLAGFGCQVGACVSYFKDDYQRGDGRPTDPDFLSLVAGFWLQMAGLYIIIFGIFKFADRYLRWWLISMSVLSLLLSGSGLGFYFLYTTVGDTLMWFGGLAQIWTFKMIAFHRKRDDYVPRGSPAPSIGSQIPLTGVQSPSPCHCK